MKCTHIVNNLHHPTFKESQSLKSNEHHYFEGWLRSFYNLYIFLHEVLLEMQIEGTHETYLEIQNS